MSKLGASVSTAARNRFGEVLAAGAPLLSLIDQNTIEEAHQHGAVAVFRTQRGTMGEDNPPSFMDRPLSEMAALGRAYLDSQWGIWQQNAGADWYAINNEQDVGTLDHALKLNEFFWGAMQRADELGVKLCICNFSTGCPNDEGGLTLEQRWEPLLSAVAYAEQHGHIIGLHAHAGAEGNLIGTGESIAFRHERTLRYFAQHGLHPRVAMTELSNGVEGIEPNLAVWWQQMTAWDLHVMESPWRGQVIGAALYGWTADATLTPAVDVWTQWLIAHPDPVDPPPSVDEWEVIDVQVDGISVGAMMSGMILMDKDHTLQVFTRPKPASHSLTVVVTPEGSGLSVTPSSGLYPHNVVVEWQVI